MIFRETPVFTRRIQQLLSDDQYCELQACLAETPDAGAVVPNSGGLRKIRWAPKGQGKRGGLRVIYYWAVGRDLVYMIYIYPKSKQSDLSSEQLQLLRKTVEKEFP